MQWNGNAGRQFVATDEICSLNVLIAAVYRVGKGVKTEINRGAAPGSLLDGAQARFRQVSQSNAGGGNRGRGRGCGDRQGEETFVTEAGEIQAEASEIVRKEHRAAHFGVGGFAERVGEGQTEGKRGKMVEVGHEAPAAGEQGLDFQALLLATLRIACAVRVEEAAVLDTEIGVLNRSVFERLGAE